MSSSITVTIKEDKNGNIIKNHTTINGVTAQELLDRLNLKINNSKFKYMTNEILRKIKKHCH